MWTNLTTNGRLTPNITGSLACTLGQSVTKLMNPDTAGPSSSESKASRRTSIVLSKATVLRRFDPSLQTLEVIAGTRPHIFAV